MIRPGPTNPRQGSCHKSYKLRVTVDCIIEAREGKNQKNGMRGRNLFADLTSTSVREHGP